MATKQPVKKNGGALVKSAGGGIAGLEGITQDMLTIPRVKIVQKNSVEVDDGFGKPGMLVNSINKDIIAEPKKPIIILPLQYKPSRIFFRPFGEGGGLACQSRDNINGEGDPGGKCKQCPHFQWPTEAEKNAKGKNKKTSPDCTELINIFCMIRGYDFPIPMTVSFGRTSMKAGKQLRQMLYTAATQQQKNPWNFAYEIVTVFKENDKGTYFEFKSSPAGMAKAAEIKLGDQFYRLISTTDTVIHEDEDEIAKEQGNINKKDEPIKDEPVPGFDKEADEEDPFGEDDE
jgi:hypothetical protein